LIDFIPSCQEKEEVIMGREATYKVTLSEAAREELTATTRKGKESAREVLFARALLLLDEGEFGIERWKVDVVATAVGMSDRTLEYLKERRVQFGLDAALERKKPCTPSKRRVFDGEFAAQLTRLACSPAPEGWSRWTARLLAEKFVELSSVPTVSVMTVQKTLKKRTCASSEQVLEDSAGRKCGLCCGKGRRSRSLQKTLRHLPVGHLRG
jgi:hypothetical protein